MLLLIVQYFSLKLFLLFFVLFLLLILSFFLITKQLNFYQDRLKARRGLFIQIISSSSGFIQSN